MQAHFCERLQINESKHTHILTIDKKTVIPVAWSFLQVFLLLNFKGVPECFEFPLTGLIPRGAKPSDEDVIMSKCLKAKQNIYK